MIAASRSTKNKAGERNPEMTSTKKGNTWHFGWKAHVETERNGLGTRRW